VNGVVIHQITLKEKQSSINPPFGGSLAEDCSLADCWN
jgi:hypothetical protein